MLTFGSDILLSASVILVGAGRAVWVQRAGVAGGRL